MVFGNAGLFNNDSVASVGSPTTSATTSGPSGDQPAGLDFRFGGEQGFVSIAEFASSERTTAVATQLRNAGSIVVSCWGDVLLLDEPAQQNLLALVAACGRNLHVHQDREGAPLLSPFYATLVLPISAGDLVAIGRCLRLLIRFAVLFHSDAIEAAARTIWDGFHERNISVPLPQALSKAIRELCPQVETENIPSAKAAALAFIRSDALNIYSPGADCANLVDQDGAHYVRFWKGDFYIWTGRAWQQLDYGLLCAKLVRFLQDSGTDPNDASCTSVLLNMQGPTLIDDWTSDPPFWVADGSSDVQHRRVIVCSNGYLDLDEILPTRERVARERTLHPHNPHLFNLAALPYPFESGATCPLWLQTLE